MSLSASEEEPSFRDLLDQVHALPELPGVYRFFDEQGQLLYVGKAVNLRSRVSSYFRGRVPGTRIAYMVARIRRMETTVVRTEAEALLLENNLIKALRPRFNIVFRDDKSYPYLALMHAGMGAPDHTEAFMHFPRLAYARGGVNKQHLFFGPYPNAHAVKDSIRLLQKVFRLRTCEDTVFSNRTRPCLLFDIKRCSGPCVGHISPVDYHRHVQSAVAFLRGETQRVLTELQDQMQAHAERLEFESAAAVRDQIAALSTVLQQQSVESSGDTDADIIAVQWRGGRACVILAMVRGGRHLGDRAFFPKNVDDAVDAGEGFHESGETLLSGASDDDARLFRLESCVLERFLAQHYIDTQLPPPLLVVSHPVDGRLKDLLARECAGGVRLVDNPRGIRRQWLEMAKQNAAIQLTRVLSETTAQQDRIRLLLSELGLQIDDLGAVRIECFDISHSSGEATYASCVVFHHHQMQPSEYRRFRIDGITPGDDYEAMRLALRRRYGGGAKAPPVAANDKFVHTDARPLPSIVLVDGGVGQVNAAAEVFLELGLSLSVIVGVEKGDRRKVGLEELVFADGRSKLTLRADSPALMLVAQVRDEAHRFAITGMRARRAKARTGGSALEEIPGVGPQRRARLLRRFGGVRGVAEASVEDLMTVEGISRALAERIYAALR